MTEVKSLLVIFSFIHAWVYSIISKTKLESIDLYNHAVTLFS